VAKDIAEILEYTNTMKAICDHIDEEDKMTCKEFKNINQNVLFSFIIHPITILTNESGLYSLILRSKNEKAYLFKRHVTSVILPSIRKYGQYGQYKINMEDEKAKILLELKEEKINKSILQCKYNNLLLVLPKYTYRVGNVIFFISNPLDNRYKKKHYIRFGKTNCINTTLNIFGNYIVHYLFYIEDIVLFENIIKYKYEDKIHDKEWIVNIPIKSIVKFIRDTSKILNAVYLENYVDENIVKNNKEQNETQKVKIEEIIEKKKLKKKSVNMKKLR
jgi:prophage antirepressor-like protein